MVGAAAMVATRFSVRLLGLVSVTILARLLTPEDFGVFGTAALVLAFFIMVKEIGFGEAVIKTQGITKEDIDTLWTIRFLLSCLAALALFFLAGPIASFLKEPRVIDVLRLMAFIPVLDSFCSPASSLLLKEFKYGSDFILKSSDKLVRVIAVIILALTLKSYWALVFGSLLAAVFGVIVSHIARPYKPSLTLAKWKTFGSFSLWIYSRGVGKYLGNSADELVVRASENSAFFGIYHVSRDISRILITELISPIGEALLPALVKFSGEIDRFSSAVRNIVGVYLIVGVAVALGIILTSNEIVLLLLGPQWGEAGRYLALIAIGSACNSMADVNQSIFIAKNVPRYGAIFWGVRASSYFVFCLISGIFWGAEGVAITFSLVSIVMLSAELVSISFLVPSKDTWFLLFVRPVLAGGAMCASVLWGMPSFEAPIGVLAALKVLVGASVYIIVLVGLWWISGKPKGPEHALLQKLPQKVQAFIL